MKKLNYEYIVNYKSKKGIISPYRFSSKSEVYEFVQDLECPAESLAEIMEVIPTITSTIEINRIWKIENGVIPEFFQSE